MIVRSDSFIANPVVTCSIIVYNQKQWIGACLDGVLQQECEFPFNIVVSDDCSTDGTQDVLRDYQSRYPDVIKLVLNEKNGGIAANWVSCCKALEGGEYVAFCDGDDYWSYPQKLQVQYNYMQEHAECSGMTTASDYIDENNIVTKAKSGGMGRIITQEQIWEQPISVNSGGLFFRKKIFDKVMPFDAFVEQNFPFQDWPALLIMAGYGNIYYLPIATFTCRLGHVSDSHPNDFERLEARMERGSKMYDYLHLMFPKLNYQEDEYETYTNSVLLRFCIKTGDYKRARQCVRHVKVKSLREWSCYTWVSFQLYRLLKKMKSKR